jgi:uncharacterized protein YaeQ
MITNSQKMQVIDHLNRWIVPSRKDKSGSALARRTNISGSYISQLKNGKTTTATGTVIPDGYYLRLAKEMGLDLKDRPRWSTNQFEAITGWCDVVQADARRLIIDGPVRMGKTYSLEWYSTHYDQVLYVKAVSTMRKRDLLMEIVNRLNIEVKAKGDKALMDSIRTKLTEETGWLIIIDEAELISSSLWYAIKEIEDFSRDLAGVIVCGAGIINQINHKANREKKGFPQIRGRFFTSILRIEGLHRDELKSILTGAGITDKAVIGWFTAHVTDYDMLSQYMVDLRKMTEGKLADATIEMVQSLQS